MGVDSNPNTKRDEGARLLRMLTYGLLREWDVVITDL